MKPILVHLFFIFIISAKIFPQIYLDSTASIDDRVQDLLSRMTLDEKVGQMTQADRGHLQSMEDIKNYYLGSILSGGGSAPAENTAECWADMYDAYQAKALETRLGIPIIYGIDAVHGHNNVIGAVIFPHNIGMGCTWNPELVQEAARITALEVAGTGIDWTFAPCIAVPQNERWGRTYEGYGETAEITTIMSETAVIGFQGDSLADSTSIVACAKHFIGDGGTTDGIDQGNTEVDENTLRAIHMPGYVSAINAGVGTVMASYSSWNGQKIHGSHYLLTDVLKTELGFEGFIVSDWNAIDQLEGDYNSDVQQAINAGIDMAMAPDTYSNFYSTLIQLVNNGDVPMSRIDDAVSRILRVKFEMGLFERPFTNRNLTYNIGCEEHRQIARQCVRESMVLLKKENDILPLSRSGSNILVAGGKADNLGYQCGGWTISWQGGSGDITDGTTILEAIQNTVDGSTVVYSADGSNTDGMDIGVVVIGERPYAEGQGDDDDLGFSDDDVETLRRVKNAGIPTVVILISGRPMILDRVLHYSDILFAAWLPGTEGDGITDILFADYQPSGLLTHSWPGSMDQIPINWGDDTYDPLYPYKHGIASIENYGVESDPIFHSAILLQSGNVIEAAFSKPMALPALDCGFEVEINHQPQTIMDIRLKNNDLRTMEIELDAQANAGDSIFLSYTSGSVAALDGSLLQSFDQINVYNLHNEGSGAHTIPGRVEAENYSDMFGVQLEPTTDIGGGSNVGYIDNTDWMDYDLIIPDSGDYQLDLRVAAESQSARIGFVFDGNLLSYMDLPVTGGWQNWETVTTTIILDQGLHTLKIFAFIGGYNLNWMDFSYPTTISSNIMKPSKFRLDQNFPNPFNPVTVIRYQLSTTCQVKLNIYNNLGQKVVILVSKKQSVGEYTIQWDASKFASGIYYYQLKAGDFSSRKKMLLMK